MKSNKHLRKSNNKASPSDPVLLFNLCFQFEEYLNVKSKVLTQTGLLETELLAKAIRTYEIVKEKIYFENREIERNNKEIDLKKNCLEKLECKYNNILEEMEEKKKQKQKRQKII